MKLVLEVGAVKRRWNSLCRVGEVCGLTLEGHCGWGDKKTHYRRTSWLERRSTERVKLERLEKHQGF
jgi:hypothetical protein